VPFNPSDLVFKHATLIGTLSAGVNHYHRALEFMRSNRGTFDWSAMTATSYELHEINEAFARMASWQDIKPVIRFG
jgi:Zn-dependent alcohol dehydrogenase